jgi:exodeoxyribonuclease VII small subunit
MKRAKAMAGKEESGEGEESGRVMKFGEKLETLDEILRRMEEEKLPLDEALLVFERGVALIRELQEFLEKAEQKVTLLARDGGEVPFKKISPETD